MKVDDPMAKTELLRKMAALAPHQRRMGLLNWVAAFESSQRLAHLSGDTDRFTSLQKELCKKTCSKYFRHSRNY